MPFRFVVLYVENEPNWHEKGMGNKDEDRSKPFQPLSSTSRALFIFFFLATLHFFFISLQFLLIGLPLVFNINNIVSIATLEIIALFAHLPIFLRGV